MAQNNDTMSVDHIRQQNLTLFAKQQFRESGALWASQILIKSKNA